MEQHFYPAGEGLSVAFDVKAVKNDKKSLEAGRLVCDEVVYLTKLSAKDRNSRIHRPLREVDRQQYSKQYEHWQQGQQSGKAEGTPLEQWACCSRGQVEELRFKHVRTLEQLAGMSERDAADMGGEYPALRKRAGDFMELAKGGSPLLKLRAELEEREAELQVVKEQLAQALAELKESREMQEEPSESPTPSPRCEAKPRGATPSPRCEAKPRGATPSPRGEAKPRGATPSPRGEAKPSESPTPSPRGEAKPRGARSGG